jgi:xanthine/uracil permease
MNFKQALDAVFPPFSEPKRVKPREILFIAEEKPELSTALVVAAQHTIVVLTLVVFTVIVGKQVGLSDAELRGFVALEIVCMGLATLLQGLPTRFSSGHLIVHNPSVISIASVTAVAGTYGLGAAMGGLIVSGLLVIFLSSLLPKIRSLFPPEVTGVLLVLLGLSMVEGGVRRFTGFDGETMQLASILTASTTLGVIILMSVWAPGRLRVFAIFAGVVSGLIVAVVAGLFGSHEMGIVGSEPLLALPFDSYDIPAPEFIFAAIIPILLIEVISAVDSIGTAVAIDKMNNAKWHRADMGTISRTVTCHGIGVLCNGLLGTHPVGTSSANLGLVAATGVGARMVGVMAGGMLLVLAFLPQVSTFMALIPQPVVGAIIVYTAAYMVVVGMELILSRMLNTRRMFMVGLGITVGMTILAIPQITNMAPESMKPVVGSALTMGVVTAIVLNQLFRIGISETGTIELTGIHAIQELTEFLEEKGSAWGARRDVMTRAGLAVGEALEKLNGSGMATWPMSLTATFDEYKLILELVYEGEPVSLEPKPVFDLDALLEDDAAIDNVVSNISGALITPLADKTSSFSKDNKAVLRLVFDH